MTKDKKMTVLSAKMKEKELSEYKRTEKTVPLYYYFKVNWKSISTCISMLLLVFQSKCFCCKCKSNYVFVQYILNKSILN